MYGSLRNRPRSAGTSRRAPIPRTVLFLGLTSMFTDISTEMVSAVLPIFLTIGLGLSPVQFGIVDGLYHGVSAVSRLAAGVVSDRMGKPKIVATVGYGLSALTKPLLILASTAAGVAALVTADRIGKGIRTAPRDAMIAQASTPDSLGGNFGVHRALDNLGAMIGPLLAFVVLLMLPDRFDAVFVVSTAAAVLGVAVLVLLVPAGPRRGPQAMRLRGSDLTRLMRSGAVGRRVGLAGALTLFTVSDAFIFLTLLEGNRDLSRLFPLFAVGLALAYAALAIPVGRLADRVGRLRVYLAGNAVLLIVYLIVAQQSSAGFVVIATLALLGLHYAATDGVLAASLSAVLPEASKASGLAMAQTVVALSAFGASVGFGLLIGWLGWSASYLVMGIGLAIVLAAGAGGLAAGSAR